jgi:TRAP-type C4-dicarboxylate transport system permease small subunit
MGGKIFKSKLIQKNMNKWIELLLGLILVIVAIVVMWYSANWSSFWNFRHAAWEFLKGGVFWFVLGVGLLLILLGISDLKE